MVDPLNIETLNSIDRLRLENKKKPLTDRLAGLSEYDTDQLACFSTLNLSLTLEGINKFMNTSNLPFILENGANDWVYTCLERALLQVEIDSERIFFQPDEDAIVYYQQQLSTETKLQYHQYADDFFQVWLTDVVDGSGMVIPEDKKERRAVLLAPNGALDRIIHLPQVQRLFSSSLHIAISWQEHLFQLGLYTETSQIVNMICFPIDRQGQHQFAQALLVRVISVTTGLPNLVSKINLATLLRGDSQYDLALRIYRRTIPALIKARAYAQLVSALSEMGTIYRQMGHLLPAAALLELCSWLQGMLKNYKSQAVTRSHLASVYRYLRFFGPALRSARLAGDYFRESGDLPNLGRSLLTHGNILYNFKCSASAMACFDEALAIGRQISDPQAICGALGGKARLNMFTGNLEQVKPLLDEAIAIRQRNSDHSIGVEYQNMGSFYKTSGNLALALVWYRKALKIFEQYTPVEVAHVKKDIQKVEKLQAKKRKSLPK